MGRHGRDGHVLSTAGPGGQTPVQLPPPAWAPDSRPQPPPAPHPAHPICLQLLTHLLQLCSGLPLAPGLVTRGNVATQLELLLAAEAALGGAAAVPG